MTGKELIEMKQKRANIVSNIRAIMDEYENKEMGQEKENELSNLEKEFDNLNNTIINEEKQIERERITGEVANEENNNSSNADNDIVAAFSNVLSNPSAENVKIYNALQQDNPTQAGYLVAPEKFVTELIKTLDNNLLMRRICKVLEPLKNAQSLGHPKMTADLGDAVWGTEIQAPTPDTSLAFGKKELKPNPATAEILVSKTLIRNASNVDSIVRERLDYKFGELMENGYMNGSGVLQPLGIFVASGDGISTSRDVSTGNTTTEAKFDGLMEAKYSIKAQYRKRAQWIFHRDVMKKLVKLKDSNGQYIWNSSVKIDEPDRLLSSAVNESEYAPNTMTTGLYVGMYGDFSYYWIVDSLALEIQALMELAARTNQVDYIARLETDGCPVLEEAFARVKLA